MGATPAANSVVDGERQVARPYASDATLIATMTLLGNEALELYAKVVTKGLTGLSNLDLDTGQPINPQPTNS